VQRATEDTAAFIGGFVAAEGTFTMTGTTNLTFRFAVALGATDGASCEALHRFLGVGHIAWARRRQPHHDDVVIYSVQAQRELLEVIVPFMDEHLPESYKRQQYSAWKAAFLDYMEYRARRRRTCTVEGCDEPRRAHGLCRHHLWTHRNE
jgi:LAGLIDADG endonuclease